jgi:hypothetical protein
MLKKAFFAVAVICGFQATQAQASGVDPVNVRALSRLNQILDRSAYWGVTPAGRPCQVRVIREFSYGGNPVGHMRVIGQEAFGNILSPYPVFHDAGQFQLGVFGPEFSAKIEKDNAEMFQVYAQVGPVHPQLPAYPQGTTLLTLRSNGNGQLDSLTLEESVMDPGSGFSWNRRFRCGSN